MKLSYVAGLLCLLLFVAAVDTIPDPPAVSPPTSHGLAVSALHNCPSSTALEKKWLVASLLTSLSFRWVWVVFRLAVEGTPVFSTLSPLVLCAADSSPPSLS